jgi:hypothetical protein
MITIKQISLVAMLTLMCWTVRGDDTDNFILGNLQWASGDGGAPQGDCPKYGACCITTATGWFPRNQIIAQAIMAAKNNACPVAVTLALATQCHNSDVATVYANHPDRVCAILQTFN